MANVDFAVIDVETTGFSPAKHDRVIEIAIIRVDGKGRTIDEYSTLVNPKRDVGPTHVHGISASDLVQAPEFIDIAGDVLERLSGAVLTAHNARFDLAFINSEFCRVGIQLPETASLCTLQLVTRTEHWLPSRRLDELCRFFGIELRGAHSALEDARATKSLLFTCIKRLRCRLPVQCSELCLLGTSGQVCERASWPKLPANGVTCTRVIASERLRNQASPITSMLSRLPPKTDEFPELIVYLELLDRVLEDRRVTEEEMGALEAVATDLGLSREQVVKAHESYFIDLVRIAMADNILSDLEQKDLDLVRRLLALSEARASELIASARRWHSDSEVVSTCGTRCVDRAIEGKTVCFTGELQCTINGERISRSIAEDIAQRHGMVIRKGVSKKLDYLVAADPDSMSGKAVKARDYGIPVIAELVFWQMLGIDTE